jgi:hypothetical protein
MAGIPDTNALINSLGNAGSELPGTVAGEDVGSRTAHYEQQAQAPSYPVGGPVVAAGPVPQQPAPNYARTPARRRANSLSALFLRFGPEKDVNFSVELRRIFPRTGSGSGWLNEFPHAITNHDIFQKYGGGRYQVTVMGTDNKTGQPGAEKESISFDIAGEPKVEGVEPQGGRRSEGGHHGGGGGGGYGMPPAPTVVHPDTTATNLMAQALTSVVSGATSGKDQLIDRLQALAQQPANSPISP